jgi:hypothetical protein
VDNLAPSTPSPFYGQYSNGVTQLAWGANPEPDFASYRLYRGTSPDFVPGPGNLIATLSQPGYLDNPGIPHLYKLSAVDVHGNESPHAFVVPLGVVGVENEKPSLPLALARATPNPAFEHAVIRFTLPAATRVDLGVFDAAGRRLRSLRGGDLAAGEHVVPFDLRDDAGQPVPSGLYFVQLQAAGRRLVRRMAVIR